jgi:hypothetical protein
MLRAVVLLFIILCHTAYSQNYEIGLWGGGSNLISDVGRTNYVMPNNFAAGLIAKWNRSERHSFRATILYANILADDSQSDDQSRVLRDLSLEYPMIEVSLGIEYTFVEFDLHKGKPQFSPYLHLSVAAFRYDAFGLSPDGTLQEEGTETGFAIPFGLGMKFNLSRHFIMGLEVGTRYTFTDNLDGSNPSSNTDLRSFGNLSNNDWYTFVGATITYTFGRRPCYYKF